ncbi:hypothetical protein XELAEV_18015385mg [Xenopus laevis]|uniref:Uncharacterized protein n=1 Tax=Xenopus laevis TaxID=8355 RepID=A0A974HW44_XENLA|nr:hypothetical protein XELAEV_18015385mg [Xenopus laevis]
MYGPYYNILNVVTTKTQTVLCLHWMVSAPNGKYLLWCSISSAILTQQLASLVLRLYALNPGFSADTSCNKT